MAFVAVAKHRNITKAAQELRVTQPSVSKHIKVLEKDYRVKLFEREAGRIELTNEGTLFLRYAKDILFLIEKLDREFGIVQSKRKVETLKVGGSHGSSTFIIPSLVAKFKQLHPEIPIALRTGSSKTLEKMLLNGEIEVALLHMKPDSANLSSEFFREETLIIFVARSHRLAPRKTISVFDLNSSQLAATGGRDSVTEKILKVLANDGLKTRVTIRCETPEAVKIIVSKGMAVGILFEDSIMPEIRKGLFKALHLAGIKLTGNSYIVYRKDTVMSRNAREFLGLIRQWRRNFESRSKSPQRGWRGPHLQ
jgi:DNA-binding transcriptional LysR family regulator